MSFVIKKKSIRKGKERYLHYLVRSYRENGKSKRKTLVKMFEEDSIPVILSKLEKNKLRLEENIKACRNKSQEITVNKKDSNYHYAQIYIYSQLKQNEDRLKKVMDTYNGVKEIISKYPLSSARNPNNN